MEVSKEWKKLEKEIKLRESGGVRDKGDKEEKG